MQGDACSDIRTSIRDKRISFPAILTSIRQEYYSRNVFHVLQMIVIPCGKKIIVYYNQEQRNSKTHDLHFLLYIFYFVKSHSHMIIISLCTLNEGVIRKLVKKFNFFLQFLKSYRENYNWSTKNSRADLTTCPVINKRLSYLSKLLSDNINLADPLNLF